MPKYKIGELVTIRFASDYCPTSSYVLKDGVGLVSEVLLYVCTDYDEEVKHKDPTYIVEYKILPASKNSEIRYVSEEHLEPLDREK